MVEAPPQPVPVATIFPLKKHPGVAQKPAAQ
jgi:hypothetical protein